MRCTKCGEPWFLDSIHEEIEAELGRDAVKAMSQEMYERDYFIPKKNEFVQNGCVALGSSCNGATASPIYAEVYELLGDDVDGAENLLEDFGYG